MALQPVSGVTPARANNVNFGSRNYHKQPEETPSRNISGLKAVPIAVLIAMSPMTETRASEIMAPEPATTEVAAKRTVPKPQVIGTHVINKDGKKIYELKKLNLDGNSKNYEAVELVNYYLDGDVRDRALITGVYTGTNKRNGEKHMTLSGVRLTEDPNEYKPKPGIFREYKIESFNERGMYELEQYFKKTVNETGNNGAFDIQPIFDWSNDDKNYELKNYFDDGSSDEEIDYEDEDELDRIDREIKNEIKKQKQNKVK